MKLLWETKSVFYDYKLNQYFAFFILSLFSGGGLSTFLIICVVFIDVCKAQKTLQQSPAAFFH